MYAAVISFDYWESNNRWKRNDKNVNKQMQFIIAAIITCGFILCTASMPDNSDSIDYRERSMKGFEKIFPVQNQN